MSQTLKNLRIWFGFAVLAGLATLSLPGNLGLGGAGPVCTEASGPGAPGFTALPGGAVPACLRVRIG